MQTLQYGDSGIFVRYLQLALTRAGYNPGNIDGVFGTRTLDALTAFQRDNGLLQDGIAGRLTWARLYPYLAGYTMHVASAGDTFYGIAARHDTSVAAIQAANPDVLPDNIPIGKKLVVPLDFDIVPTDVPYSFALNTILLDGLTARYPFLHVETVGASAMGKPLEAVYTGVGTTEVFYNASHHANEWITSTLVMRYLENYAHAIVTGGTIAGEDAARLYAGTKLYLLPLVNPDGVDLVTGALPTEDSYYTRARAMADYYPAIPFPEGWKANIAGVDLNLSYPAGWEQARRIKFAQGFTRPGPRDFVGTAPLSQPESRAVYDYTRAHDFRLTLSYHTQGGVIFYKFLNYDPPRATEIADAFAAASGYEAQTTPYESGFAGYKDWFIQTYNLPGYTIEAGRGVSPLPLAQFPAIYRENEGILTLGMALLL